MHRNVRFTLLRIAKYIFIDPLSIRFQVPEYVNDNQHRTAAFGATNSYFYSNIILESTSLT